jgi:hypothetical protein
MIEKEFVPYEEALALKELGFNEPCLASYFHAGKRLDICEYINHGEYTVLAPTFSQAFRWFREKYKLHYSVDYECSQHDHKWGYNYTIYNYSQVVKTNEEYIQSNPIAPAGEWVYETHEEAEIECLKKLIELVKQGGNK